MALIDTQKLSQALPLEVNQLLELIHQNDFMVYLVGGPLRDYLLNDEMCTDLDFELQHKDLFDQDEWLEKIFELQNKISQKFTVKIEKLPFGIFKMDFGPFQCEFASARLESYQKGKKFYHHSEFDSKLVSQLDQKQALKRRDLTVNAMALDLKSGEIFDPYSGLKDLEEKILRPVNPDFEKDPVRFLRAHRFKQSLGFQFSADLEKKLTTMNLTALSDFAIQKEVHKSSDPLSVFLSLKKMIDKSSIKVSDTFKEVLALPFFQKKKKIQTTGSLLVDCLSLAEAQITPKHQDVLCDFFRWKRKDFKSYLTLYTDLVSLEKSGESLAQMNLDQLLEAPLLGCVKRLIDQHLKNDPLSQKLISHFAQAQLMVSTLESMDHWNGEANLLHQNYPPRFRSLLPAALYFKGRQGKV